jgi:hypothetical protein
MVVESTPAVLGRLLKLLKNKRAQSRKMARDFTDPLSKERAFGEANTYDKIVQWVEMELKTHGR